MKYSIRGGRKHRRGGQSTTTTAQFTNMSDDEETSSSMKSSSTTSPLTMDGGRKSHKFMYASRARRGGKSRRRRGGQSASSYGSMITGDANSQWNNVFNNPTTMNAPTGNGLWSADLKQNVSGGIIDQKANPALAQSAGAKKRKARRAGSLLNVVGQAIVPFGLLGLQQTFKKKSVKGGKTSKRRRH